MAIKGVGNGQNPYGRIKIQRETERLDDNTKTAKNPTVRRDEVCVSEDARLMNVAMDAIRNTPETRAEKVARLKAMVDNGSYTPNSAAIAAKMVAEEQEIWK